ncbi:ATP synthase protein I [Weizmannia acidilactici]|jgi:ATP synthase protein I|uniref:ATP synthase protein I n=1 Tax=Weizmannia acidilactici TaxID=2607726 RepID=A0A5J4J3E0_9BACI|nr:ATP synthase subunit I [Weizmannia acidilactici]GER66378.1 ATP synthase protein I [Weizmannia acidilactici]GER69476.1 ATP synthase protein I [Weizmannia acidilactici]GER73013.1 ATP synthase protein I [Weizmannia acidilactici]
MPEFIQVYKRQRKYLVFLLLFYLMGLGLPPYRPVFLGLLLGTSVSLFNLWLLAKRTISVTNSIDPGKKPRAMGTGLRMTAAVIAVLFALRYPGYIDVLCVIIGIMTAYVVIMIDFFVGLLRQRKM